jgi:hypothetical protein
LDRIFRLVGNGATAEASLFESNNRSGNLVGLPTAQWSFNAGTATPTGGTLVVAGDFQTYAVIDRVGITAELIPHLFSGNTAGAFGYPVGWSARPVHVWPNRCRCAGPERVPGSPLLDTSYVADLIPGLRAGVYGSSFRFKIVRENLDNTAPASSYNPKALPERTITEATVMEFGPVTFPAYEGATAGVRSLTYWWLEAGELSPTARRT